MEINIIKTEDYYKDNLSQCSCEYCSFFRENVDKIHPRLATGLKEMGIVIKKPYELGLPYLEGDKIIYPFAQYLVMGTCSKDFSRFINRYKIYKAEFYPSVSIKSAYFILEVESLDFDIDLASDKLLKDF